MKAFISAAPHRPSPHRPRVAAPPIGPRAQASRASRAVDREIHTSGSGPGVLPHLTTFTNQWEGHKEQRSRNLTHVGPNPGLSNHQLYPMALAVHSPNRSSQLLPRAPQEDRATKQAVGSVTVRAGQRSTGRERWPLLWPPLTWQCNGRTKLLLRDCTVPAEPGPPQVLTR